MTASAVFQPTRDRNAQGLYACIGFDTTKSRMPRVLLEGVSDGTGLTNAIVTFNTRIFDRVAHKVAAAKPNSAFYEAEGIYGWDAMSQSVSHMDGSGVTPLWDAKREDIGNTVENYVQAARKLGMKALTIGNYPGQEGQQPFLDSGLGCFVLCCTSNKGRGEFQDKLMLLSEQDVAEMSTHPISEHIQYLGHSGDVPALPNYLYVGYRATQHWDKDTEGEHKDIIGLVFGATFPSQLKLGRDLFGKKVPFLIPGIGAQEGDIWDVLEANQGGCAIFNISRGALYASDGPDYAEAAEKVIDALNEKVNRYLQRGR